MIINDMNESVLLEHRSALSIYESKLSCVLIVITMYNDN